MSFKIRLIVFYVCVYTLVLTSATCRDGSYNDSITCIPCPSNCATCASDTSCLQCKNGFYGDRCKIPCLHNCSTHGCHLQYGHCTQCPDGHFSKDNQSCIQCPKTCDVCNSTSNCFRCRNGYYGQDCSKICEAICEGGTCNQTTGHCLQCKTGYYRQGDTCMQCPEGCKICNNSTNCSTCQETLVGQFQGKCFRKCTEKSKFVSKFNQRCGISLKEIKSNRSSCLTVNIERKYTCKSFRPCIECRTAGGDCRNLNSTTKNEVCVRYEQCIATCNPDIPKHEVQYEGEVKGKTRCEETCSVNHSGDENDSIKQMCPIKTKENTPTSEEISYIACFQEHTTDVNSPEDRLTEASVVVVVVVVSVLVILLIGNVYLQLRKRINLLTEVAHDYDSMNQVPVTSTHQRVPSVENVYDRGNCSQAVTRNHMYSIIAKPQCRSQIQDDMSDTESSFAFETDNNVYNKINLKFQSRGRVADIYDTTNCFDIAAGDRKNNTTAVPSQQSKVDDDLYDLVDFDQLPPSNYREL